MVFDLICVRDEKKRNFRGLYRDEGSVIRFILEEGGHDQLKEGYIVDFTILNIDVSTMRVQNMCIDIERYRGIGIPEALIIKAKELLDMQIISSTNSRKNDDDDINEGITEQAKKVWKRLICRKLAYYDCETDRYKTI